MNNLNDAHKWALPASIALLAGSVLVSAVVISAPLTRLANGPIQVQTSGGVRVDGKLELSSMFGLGGLGGFGSGR